MQPMHTYEQWMKSEGKSGNTIKRYVRIAMDFQQWYVTAAAGQAFDPKLVSAIELQDWKSFLLSATYQGKDGKMKQYSVSSVNNCLKGIKVYFDYLQAIGSITMNPAGKLKPQKLQGAEEEPRWLDRAERSRLLFYIDNEQLRKKNAWRFTRNRAVVFVMLHAGLRACEVVDLNPEDLHFEEKILHVRNGKGGKSRNVDMNKDLIAALRDWLQQRGQANTRKLFVSQRGGPLTEDGLTYLFDQIREKVGIPDLTPHVLRHTFAHDLTDRGTPLQMVAQLLGHSNINYTLVYVTASRQERRQAVNKLAGERYSE